MKFFALAATLSVSLAVKQGRTPTASLLEEISAVEATETDTAQEEVAECHKHNCSMGWVPKPTHAELTGATDSDCCVETCQKWTCDENAGWKSNPAYFGNLQSSEKTNEKCCDALCKLHECPRDWVVPAEKQGEKGATTGACCEKTCALATCVTPKVKPVDNDTLASVDTGDCCDNTCASFVCPDGQMQDPKASMEVASLVGGIPKHNGYQTNGGHCCLDTCKAIVGKCNTVGKEGYTVPPRKYTELATQTELGLDSSHCCHETCANHVCTEENGWKNYAAGGVMPHCFGDCTDSQCCQPTCRNWECGEGLKLDSTKANQLPAGDGNDICCVKTCKLHTCLDTYVPGSNFMKNDTVGDTSEVCCEKWCSTYTCSDEGSAKIPDADKVPGSTNPICCEDARCPKFRNMTKTESAGCNSLSASKEDCENAYTDLENFKDGGWDKVSCEWDAQFDICRVSDNRQPAHCGGRVAEGAAAAAATTAAP